MAELTGAMLASLHIRMWRGTVRDEEIASFVEDEYHMPGTISLLKRIIPKEYITKVESIARIGRDQHRHLTVPGIHEGTRLLSVDLWDRYVDTHRLTKQSFVAAVDEFTDVYEKASQESAGIFGAWLQRG